MFAITLHDLRYRSRQFLIAVIGAGLVFAMALLLTALAHSFHTEVDRTVSGIGADAWVMPAGATGPFTGFSALPASAVDDVRAMPGVERADPLLAIPLTTQLDGKVHTLRLFGVAVGGLGAPTPKNGRALRGDGDAVVDARLGVGLGGHLTLLGTKLTVVGIVHGMTLLGGIPNVYTTLADSQRIAVRGQPIVTVVVTRGVPTRPDARYSVLTNAQVQADTVHALRGAILSIDNTRALMWVVAGVIVGALMYVSSLERVRDFAVLKSLGSSSWLLFVGIAVQAVVITLLAAVVAIVVSRVMSPIFPVPIQIPGDAYVALPIVAVVVGLLSSLVALRRAVTVDPSAAFASAA